MGLRMVPELFLERMEKMLGADYPAFADSFGERKYQALRLNPLKKNMLGESAATYLKPGSGRETLFELRPVPWESNGYYYSSQVAPGKHPYHDAGVYYIQEPSAMAPVPFLQVQPGDKVLDLCAAPGGKSTQIAAALEGEGLLICNEIHPARAKILSENVERMGIRNACVTNETPERLADRFPIYFDKILVDAPCSGEGMFRKNEGACDEWSPENVILCGERQDGILDCAARMLRPGGRMVYSTCTFAPVENEGSIARFLMRHPEFALEEMDKTAFGQAAENGLMNGQREYLQYAGEEAKSLAGEAAELEHTLRIWPHLVQGEGHFAAVLVKEGQVPEDYESRSTYGVEPGISEKELGDYLPFAKETLKGYMPGKNPGKYLKFGENLYLAPEELPALKGLKVLRPGLQLGTCKKNRFEPSHALALALSPEEAVHVWNLSSEDRTCIAYLNGQTFPADGEKGWYLICVDGFALGWGKLAGGMMKNHYPKGLRVMC